MLRLTISASRELRFVANTREHAFGNQLSAMSDAMVAVNLQEGNGRPTDVSHSDEHGAIPAEVIIPIVRPPIKEKCLLASCWIYRSNVGTLVVIAFETREREILRLRNAIHLLRDDMIHFKRGRIKILRNLAIFACRVRTLPNLPAQSSRYAHDSERLRAMRARDCKIPSKLLTCSKLSASTRS